MEGSEAIEEMMIGHAPIVREGVSQKVKGEWHQHPQVMLGPRVNPPH